MTVQNVIDRINNAADLKVGELETKSYPAKEDWKQSGSGWSLEVGAEASFELCAVTADKQDADRIIGEAGDDPLGVDWVPLVGPKGDDAWLKYTATATGTASANFKVLGVKGALETSIAHYRRHSTSTRVIDAITQDWDHLSMPFDRDAVLALGPGEVLSAQSAGSFEGSLTFSWSDVFSLAMPQLTSLLSAGAPLGLKFSAGATVTFKTRIEDRFKVAFACLDDSETFRMAVRRTDRSSRGGSVGLSLGVEFDNSDALKDALDALYEGLVGASFSRVEAFLGKLEAGSEFDNLSGVDKQLAEALAGRLGATRIRESIEGLASKLKAFNEKVTGDDGLLAKIARAKATLTLKYEYMRTQDDKELLLADMTAAAVRQQHASVMSLDMAPLTRSLSVRKPAGFELIHYMRQKTDEARHSVGTGLNFFGLGGTNDLEDVDRWVDQTEAVENAAGDIDLLKRSAYEGRRTYSQSDRDKDASDDGLFLVGQWGLELSAGCEKPLATTSSNDLDYTLTLHVEQTDKRLTEDELAEYIDQARVFGIVPPLPNPGFISDLFEREELKNKTVTFAYTFAARGGTLDAFCRFIVEEVDDALFHQALAAALPFHPKYRVRSNLNERIECYPPIWAEGLTRDWDWQTVGDKTALRLRDLYGPSTLGRQEDEWQGNDSGRRSKYLMSAFWARMAGADPAGDLNTFKQGCGRLLELMSQPEPRTEITSARRMLMRMVAPRAGHLLNLRVLAWLARSFTQASREAPLNADDLGLSLTIRTKEKSLVYGSKLPDVEIAE